MSESAQPTLLHRLRYTPLRDLLHGRLTCRLDVTAQIERADLSAAAKEVVKRVVRKTRLWRTEKLDVAAELIAHFLDGRDAGQSIDQLITDFGDETRAARLIRRAKVRNRPMAWHALRAVAWLLGALIAFYLVLAGYFYTGRPTIAVNYFDQLNASANAVASDQRAWPTYRAALLQIGHRTTAQKADLDRLLDARPGDDRWAQTMSWLTAHRPALELIRTAALKPELGFVLGPNGSADDPQVFPDVTPQPPDGDLISLRIPHIAEMRRFARLLAQDARLAGQEQEHRRFLADTQAILGMARQMRGQAFLIADLTAMGIRETALDAIDEAIASKPQLFTDTELQELAHRLSDVHSAADLFDARGERCAIRDVVQRAYTDDGHGDGRLTPAGLNYLRLVTSGGTSGSPTTLMLAYGPASPLVGASRKELVEDYDRLIDQAEANWAKPLREVDWDEWYSRIDHIHDSPRLRARYFPLTLMVPAMSNPHRAAERYLGHRDGIVAAIALQLHRRATGRYPDSLSQLAPALLPSVPVDRITGDPVRYRLVDGQPLIYSVGVDRDDDGGRAARTGSGPDPSRAAAWSSNAREMVDGDWVLFPQQH